MAEAHYQDAAMVLGEYGAWGPDLIGTARYLNDLLDVLDESVVGSAFWDFDFLKNKFHTFPQQFINAVARPYPEKWQGEVAFKYDYQSAKIEITWDCQQGEKMLITLPLLTFHHKIKVQGSGFKWNWENNFQIQTISTEAGRIQITIEKAE